MAKQSKKKTQVPAKVPRRIKTKAVREPSSPAQMTPIFSRTSLRLLRLTLQPARDPLLVLNLLLQPAQDLLLALNRLPRFAQDLLLVLNRPTRLVQDLPLTLDVHLQFVRDPLLNLVNRQLGRSLLITLKLLPIISTLLSPNLM